MQQISGMLNNAPWWVYVLFFYLLTIGIKASKPRVISMYKLCILPILFTLLSLHTLLVSTKLDPLSIGGWITGLFVGITIGWFDTVRHTIQIDRKKKLLKIPGSWSMLIIILFIFIAKYYFAYELDSDPQLIKQYLFEFSLLAVTGICTGLFIGKVACFFYRFKTQPTVNIAND